MWAKPLRQRLAAGRLHLQHGPIDLVLKAWGEPAAVAAAERAAWERFQDILGELVAELPDLRAAAADVRRLKGSVARRMLAACRPFAPVFITPMAAVAGAVADEVLAAMRAAADLPKAFVNDGGDIAAHVTPGQSLSLGVAGHYGADALNPFSGALILHAQDGVGGVATSGARGRSFSLGIADAVTVLAGNAAQADAAATIVANAVDCADPGIGRRPACDLDLDSDLGRRPVTVSVPPLAERDVLEALERGLAAARRLAARGLIIDCALTLQGRTRALGSLPALKERAA